VRVTLTDGQYMRWIPRHASRRRPRAAFWQAYAKAKPYASTVMKLSVEGPPSTWA